LADSGLVGTRDDMLGVVDARLRQALPYRPDPDLLVLDDRDRVTRGVTAVIGEETARAAPRGAYLVPSNRHNHLTGDASPPYPFHRYDWGSLMEDMTAMALIEYRQALERAEIHSEIARAMPREALRLRLARRLRRLAARLEG
jgi:hypothetical protein